MATEPHRYDKPASHCSGVVWCCCVWMCVVVCGCVWLCVVVCGCVWLRVVVCGYVWLCVVGCGWVLLCCCFGHGLTEDTSVCTPTPTINWQ